MWLKSNPPNSFTTWATLSQAFLSKYFPLGKTAKFRNNITSFAQYDGESLYEAWERFKDLQRKCPHHGVPDWLLVQTFYNGLNESVRITIDAAAGGAIMGKITTEVANRLLEEMTSNNYHWFNNRGKPKNAAGMYEVEGINMLNAKVDNLVNLFTKMSNVNSMSTTMPCWRNHPNFSWRNSGQQNVNVNSQHPPDFHKKQPQQEIRPSWELAIEKLANTTSERIEKLETKVDQIAISNRNVELQLGQLANAINSRSQGALPSKTEVNPKQHCNAVTLINGKELSTIKSTIKENESASESEKEKEKYEAEKEPESTPPPPLRPYVPPIPFPQRLKQTKLDSEFQKFLKMFKQLHINIPFIDALMQIPSYSKLLKEIMSKKKKLEKYETIALSEECSAMIQKKLPPKLKDPGSFSIPCTIGDIKFSKALCDLGASVSLMPLSICKKLGLHNIKSTTVSLQLADRSIKYPIGILENVLIKVDKFIIPVDFIILDMDEDIEVPIILGRPFLATAGAIIDVKNGILTFEIGEEKVHFNIFNASKFNSQRDLVCQVDIIEDMTKKKHVTDATNAPLEVCLSKTGTPPQLKKAKVRKVFPPIKECFSWRKKGEFKTKDTKDYNEDESLMHVTCYAALLLLCAAVTCYCYVLLIASAAMSC
ncbi:uncharacterized protein LOC104891359 [Beta vulgaris subsp. vulgaris]|uniref:uncharacterized protein LOC104891359 n=1 Tax=Beta vulgaris subsp. vulgaris TaxID=3555 RepID=UPI002547FA27|nr:uncharacterized protein LOC104891359 [Beta vulgaris subsp. vulgaris]